jgi:2-keto-4-pentenoate hydratase/2-oxohepta-3-ene-1,7-dioic acid hydratase in catechol pathway
MRLVTFEIVDSYPRERRVGLWDGADTVTDVNAAHARLEASRGAIRPFKLADAIVPAEMIELLAGGRATLDAAAEAAATAATAGDETVGGRRIRWQRSEVRLLSPLPRPSSIRDFLLVEEHVRNAFANIPPDRRPPHTIEAMAETPGYYKGSVETVLGPDDELTWPAYTEQLDYELELAIVIGAPGRDIPVERAHEHIAGYTIFNDWSARDIQMLEMRVGLGPGLGKDFANSLGPCIQCDPDFDPITARMVARVDDEVWSDGSIDAMLRSFPELVAWTSKAQELRPGDVIGSGTIARGCGLELGRYLWPGAVVELEVDGIGILRNRVGQRQ